MFFFFFKSDKLPVFYDQELTLLPVPKDEHWVLEELTADGRNLLGDLMVTIEKPRTIYAKFVDRTALATPDATRHALYDLRGTLVAETEAGESRMATIALADLPAGRYIVRAGAVSYSLIVQ